MNPLVLDSQRDRALNYLSRGIPPSQVALAMGVSPALISQYLADPEFAATVSASRTAAITKQLEAEESADALERSLLNQLSESSKAVLDPMKLAQLYRAVNGRVRRADTAPKSDLSESAGSPQVTLVMPQVAINLFTTDVNGQVVSVGNQSLVTMQAANLDKMAARIKENPNEQKALSISPEDFA